ncbi:MAG: hypothetical protein IJ793_00725, partial [Opitutales bacterium]|nr:hypothetical protein [Opitutales bacterium]
MKFVGLSAVFLCLRTAAGISLLAVDNSVHALAASKSAETYCNFAPSFLEISKKALSSTPVKADTGKGAQQMPSDDFRSAVVGVKMQTGFCDGSLGIPFSGQDAEITSSSTSEVLLPEQENKADPTVEASQPPLLLQAPKPLEAA